MPLLPVPRELRIHHGACRLRRKWSVELRVDDGRVARALDRWLGRAAPPLDPEPTLRLTIVADANGASHPEGYHLCVREDCIILIGATSAACFHGLQTLCQISLHDHESVPCCDIFDWPDFPTRGLLCDVTRGKVPTLATLKSLADRLASYKINQLQLYIEHAFTFAFDPHIASSNDALTPDEIREFDAYCRDRFIDLVPAVATLGHMGCILSMPCYRHLAEIEPGSEWADLGWPERARGFTLDVLNPESHKLVERIWTEILDAFSSPIVNICGDEPWDLGKGKNREHFAGGGVGEAYIEHILRTHAICARRGRRTQVWSDVVRNHPELFDRLPRDLTVLHWGYDDRSDYEGTRRFVEAGLETVVCPGTSGWKRILNAMNLAERNIADFAAAGRRHGAIGLLNTDWGDHGHFNALACSWHGIGLGAALGWRADHATGAEFDRCFAHTVVGRAVPADLIALLRDASRIADRCETWRLLWQPVAQIKSDPTLPSIEDVDRAADAASQACATLKRTSPTVFADPLDREELIVACEFTSILAGKVRCLAGKTMFRPVSAEERAAEIWTDSVTVWREKFADCWNARNKPSGLMDIRLALTRVCDDIRVALLEKELSGS